MKMELKTLYDIKAIQVIKAFVVSAGNYIGANKKEGKELELAAEEAAEHIISNHPADIAEMFDISCEGLDGMLRVVFSNKGIPVNADNLPEYVIENPADSVDGLQFFMIKKLTDNFYFNNCGSDGWQTIFEKKIAGFIDVSIKDSIADEPAAPPAGQLEVSVAAPEDAYEITKLAYFTYHYSYAKTVFYYPEMLKEAIEQSSVISFIVKTAKNEIVAHSAYLRSPYCREIAEAGALMTMPAYRRTTAIMRLVRQQHKYMKNNDIGIKIVESNLVTAHTGSQRVTKCFKFAPLAFKLSVHDRSDFIGMDEISLQREALLYSIWVISEIQPPVIYVPEVHFGILKKLTDNMGIAVEMKTTPVESIAGVAVFSIEKKAEEGLVTITIESLGENWEKELKILVRDFCVDGFMTVHLKISLWEPLPGDIDADLGSLGFFFSGIMPRTPEKWMILYTYLNNQKLDFEEIKVCDDIAVMLKDYVAGCYNDE